MNKAGKIIGIIIFINIIIGLISKEVDRKFYLELRKIENCKIADQECNIKSCLSQDSHKCFFKSHIFWIISLLTDVLTPFLIILLSPLLLYKFAKYTAQNINNKNDKS